MENPFTNSSGQPLTDILSAIRRRVSKEADERYSRERKVARMEMLILRPEARIDLLMNEPDQVVEAPAENPTQIPDRISRRDLAALGVASETALREIIREIVQEELAKSGLHRSA